MRLRTRGRDRWTQAELESKQLQDALGLQDDDIKAIKDELYKKHGVAPSTALPWLVIGAATIGVVAVAAVAIALFDSDSRQPILVSDGSTISQYRPPDGDYLYASSTSWVPVYCAREQVPRGVDGYIQTTQAQENSVRFNLEQRAPGSVSAVDDSLISQPDQYAFAVSSDALVQRQEEEARQQGFDLEAIPVARDALAFVVNSDLEVDALSQAQIKQIYEGRNGQPITWAELGFTVDDSLEAIPISRNPTDSGTARYFFLEFIRDPDFSLLQPPNSVIQLVQTVGTGGESEQGIDRVRTSPGSIFYATATELFGQPGLKPIALRSAAENQDQSLLPYNDPNFAPLVNCVNPEQRLTSAPINPDYSLTREMYVVVKNYPEDAELPSEQQNHERVGNSYACMLLSDEGQQLLQTTGYFPLSLEQRNQSRQTANCDEFLVEESTT